MIIRRAETSDFQAIWPLLRDVFRAGDTYAVDPHITKDECFAYWMTQPEATYVVEDSGAVLGTYYVRTNQPGGGAHICNCGYVVAEMARGRGLATKMCDHSQIEARALGYVAMQFNFVLGSNVGAVKLWHRLGFETVGTIPDAFDHPKNGFVDAFVMYKRLKN